jgi:hypothetical protein
MKAPLSSLIGGVAYEFFKPVYVGDKLRSIPVQKDFFEKKNKAGRRLNFVISEITYLNQNDEVVAKGQGTMIMAEQHGNQLMFERPIREYSDEEIEQRLILDRCFIFNTYKLLQKITCGSFSKIKK